MAAQVRDAALRREPLRAAGPAVRAGAAAPRRGERAPAGSAPSGDLPPAGPAFRIEKYPHSDNKHVHDRIVLEKRRASFPKAKIEHHEKHSPPKIETLPENELPHRARFGLAGLEGWPKSLAKASQYFRLAAMQGDAESQLRLGMLCEQGHCLRPPLQAGGAAPFGPPVGSKRDALGQ